MWCFLLRSYGEQWVRLNTTLIYSVDSSSVSADVDGRTVCSCCHIFYPDENETINNIGVILNILVIGRNLWCFLILVYVKRLEKGKRAQEDKLHIFPLKETAKILSFWFIKEMEMWRWTFLWYVGAAYMDWQMLRALFPLNVYWASGAEKACPITSGLRLAQTDLLSSVGKKKNEIKRGTCLITFLLPKLKFI